MKQKQVIASMMLCLAGSAQVFGQVIGEEQVVVFSYRPHVGNLGIPNPKSPVQIPYVTYLDHTLYIWSQHNGYSLTLLDDNDTVVYQSYVAPGVQYAVLPTTLSGSYTLVLSDDTYMFTGMLDETSPKP